MKKTYSAPEAQIICLQPDTAVAASGWKNGDAGWKTNGFFWSSQGFSETASKVAWYDFGPEEIEE